MPIKHDEKDIRIDFEYYRPVDEAGRQDNLPLYKIRYHFTKDNGPTVSLAPNNSSIMSFDDGEYSYISFPADVLVEIVDFLAARGMIERANLPSIKVANHPIVPVINMSDKISPPVITGYPTMPVQEVVPQVVSNVVEQSIEVNPFQSFSGENKIPEISPEEIKEIKEERTEAVERAAKNTGKKIKKKEK